MKLKQIDKQLSSGEAITIREATASDAKELIAVIKRYIEDCDFIPYAAGEFDPSLEDEVNWINSLTESINSLLLVAIHNGKIIGNISINGSPRVMLKHTAGIGIGLLKEWRNKGIGSLFFETMVAWAKENPIVEILWLETYATNKTGMALYKKFGFEESGRQNNFVKISDDKYADNVLMTLNVKYK